MFPFTGERRKRQVNDVFDWLRPVISPADIAESAEAYETNYHFQDGFVIANKLVSTSFFAIPKCVNERCFHFTPHTIVMDHPLCNVKQEVKWLSKPVGTLLNRMHALARRPNTRSSLQDACMGQDLFLYSAYVSANDFVCTTDDIEFVDFVDLSDSSKKIWHCSNVIRSSMLLKAVTAVYTENVKDDERYSAVPLWLSILQGTTKKSAKQRKAVDQIQFLGLVSLYRNKSGTKVTSFRLHSFVLYSTMKKRNRQGSIYFLVKIEFHLCLHKKGCYKFLQLIQGDQVGSFSLTIAPDFIMSDDMVKTFQWLGFTSETSTHNADWTVFHRQSLIMISKFTNRVMWGRFGQYLSFQDECSASDAQFNVFCRTVSQLLMRPTDPLTAIGLWST